MAEESCENSLEPVGWRVFNMETDMTMNIVETKDEAQSLQSDTDWAIEPVFRQSSVESRLREALEEVNGFLQETKQDLETEQWKLHDEPRYFKGRYQGFEASQEILVELLEELLEEFTQTGETDG